METVSKINIIDASKETTTTQAAVDSADIVILAVKPQQVKKLAATLQNPPNGLLLSIVAGSTVDFLSKDFTTDRIIRSMPNTPATVLEGITVWTATPAAPVALVDKARISKH